MSNTFYNIKLGHTIGRIIKSKTKCSHGKQKDKCKKCTIDAIYKYIPQIQTPVCPYCQILESRQKSLYYEPSVPSISNTPNTSTFEDVSNIDSISSTYPEEDDIYLEKIKEQYRDIASKLTYTTTGYITMPMDSELNELSIESINTDMVTN